MGRRAAICLALLFLWGCTAGGSDSRYVNVSRSELLAQLQLGHSVLGCREACLPVWRDAQPRAAQLDASHQWGDLAVLVMRTDYQDDLSLYYLGRAAEGMGFYPAAAAYYRQSMELSGTSISCVNLSRSCGGLTLPTDAARRLSVVEQQLNKPMLRRRQTIIRPPTTPATANPASEPAAPKTGEAPSTTTADDSDKGIAASPAAATPAPPNPGSAYVEPPPNAGYLEPPAIAR
jgi:hypothetical protein